MQIDPDENIKRWLRRMLRKYRLREIEYANQRQYKKAEKAKEDIDIMIDNVGTMYPAFTNNDLIEICRGK